MTVTDYASLHTHFHHSLLDGYSTVPEYLDRAVELGMTAIGSSDHGNMYNTFEFVNAARKRGLTPVPGIEAYLAPQNPLGAKVKSPVFYGEGGVKNTEFDVSANGSYLHLTMWAVSDVGLKNLFKLSSMAFEEENYYTHARMDDNMLAEHSDGIVVSTGCPSSEVSTRLLMGQNKEALRYAQFLKEVFPDRVYVEIMDHDMSIDLERKIQPKLMSLAKKLDLPLLATNDTHYAMRDDHVHHEELLCGQSGSRMSDKVYDEGGPRFAFNGNQYYLKSADEMAHLFPEHDYPGALTNSLVIAEMAQDISIDFDPTLKPTAFTPDGMSQVDYFKRLINEGFARRYGKETAEMKREAKKRIYHEFKVIESSDFIGYFLSVHEYIKWAKDNFSIRIDGEVIAEPVGPGRGSVGGSIIAYLLGISELCPIKHDLVFERFLSAGRGATYEIVYDDGSREKVVVSEERTLAGTNESRYIHQLQVGDVVLADESGNNDTIA